MMIERRTLDVEASGLGNASFPMEIGWAMVCEGGRAEARFYSHPTTTRKVDNVCQCLEPGEFEALTGITRECSTGTVWLPKILSTDFSVSSEKETCSATNPSLKLTGFRCLRTPPPFH
jgi:hypothetical protein